MGDEHITKFVGQMNLILTSLEKKMRSDLDLANIDRLKKRIRLLRSTLGDQVLLTDSLGPFMKYKEQIIGRKEAFFLGVDARAECVNSGVVITREDEYIFALIAAMKAYYGKANQAEKDILWSRIKIMFESCMAYNILIAA